MAALKRATNSESGRKLPPGVWGYFLSTRHQNLALSSVLGVAAVWLLWIGDVAHAGALAGAIGLLWRRSGREG